MAFKKPQVNQVKTDVNSLSIYLRAIKKFGKTTVFRDLVLEKFHDPSRGLLTGIGDEVGYKLLDNLNTTHAETWGELEELKQWLITTKGKEHNIEMAAFDTVDELIPLAENEIIRLSVKETGKPCKSFNAAFGGYGEPRKRMKQLVKSFFSDLTKAGISPFAISHTKVKNIKEKGEEGEGYNVLSSNLSNDCEGIFGDIFDCVLTGYIDREIVDGKIQGAQRKLYFRGNGFIDAGCRFADGSVPEYIVFNKPNMAKDLIDVLEEGMRKSRTDTISKDEFKQKQKEEIAEREQKAQEFIKEQTAIDINKNIELIKQIKRNLNKIDVASMKQIMTDYDFKDFSEPDKIKTEALEKVASTIK